MAQERITEVDILKGIAVLGVIILHVISPSLSFFPRSSLDFKLAIFVDQLFRFSVPLFVALSGYTLAQKYKEGKIDLSNFFKRRVVRLLPWYLFASAVIYAYLKNSRWAPLSESFPLWKIIFLGKADYHLYFVPMILQLYLLFPFLIAIYKKLQLKFLISLFFFQLIIYYVFSQQVKGQIDLHFFLNDQQQYIFFATWIFYFALGIALNLTTQLSKIQKAAKSAAPIFTIAAFCWMLADTWGIIGRNLDVIVATSFTRITVLIYASMFIASTIAFGNKIQNLPQMFTTFMEKIGRHSYLIYLFHTLALRIIIPYVPPNSAINIITLGTLTLATTVALSFLLQTAIIYFVKLAKTPSDS